MNNNIKLIKAGVFDLFKLPVLFRKAVNEDYGFYNQSAKQVILARNSLFRLLIAKIKKDRLVLVAYKDDSLAGILLGVNTVDAVFAINWLYVVPKYRKTGIATRLIKRAEKESLQNGCHKISVTTEIARDFYKKIGYAEEGVLKKHWWEKDFYIFGKVLRK